MASPEGVILGGCCLSTVLNVILFDQEEKRMTPDPRIAFWIICALVLVFLSVVLFLPSGADARDWAFVLPELLEVIWS